MVRQWLGVLSRFRSRVMWPKYRQRDMNWSDVPNWNRRFQMHGFKKLQDLPLITRATRR